MSKIVTKINDEVRKRTAKRCKEKGIKIPTFKQLRNPELISEDIKAKLPNIGLWDVNPLNLFRITWKNDIKNGLYGSVNYLEIPKSITGVKARIIGLVGKYFPTGAHKVGAAFGCLVPRLVSGEFDPEYHKAVWPSTGNYCRGGAFDCALLNCTSVAILPEEMSKERFEWLKSIGSEIIATPGCESNVKEIYDKCWELRKDPTYLIFNQFDEFGNPIFHYNVTAPAIEEVYKSVATNKQKLSAYISATGSAGTIGAGDYLKKHYPNAKVVASEALQCPTLLMNGFGAHRIEGIGDKHVPWVHNVRNTDVVVAIDDEDCMQVLRLFNELEGKNLLSEIMKNDNFDVENLSLLGISSISNLLTAIKVAKYYEFDENDIIFTIFTDSADMYRSRLVELNDQLGNFTKNDALKSFVGSIEKQSIDFTKELTYFDRKALHNLKYYTWVEQQGKTVEQINELWNPDFWEDIFENEITYFDQLIEEFNQIVEKS
ncbi:MAG TPA: pyridoxal-phosphate dependent enzyme [Ignavibacteriales bacterium]|nr:pyridoxal-phosphate dependent enzyme [Ignavibacteriales bacterium]HOL80781.1 pyridoxal-phosphate dependent enzyme [Ignavibacteriales bacterium]HPP33217.1 pyridoxal-phosphate dependent enzyme [Ignavibacteriales bacterium]HRR17892.1 pyridoxal-phosphate dependent enzyme [Ignavibacteriales bacterium]